MDLSRGNAQQTLSVIGTYNFISSYAYLICELCIFVADDSDVSFQDLSPLPFHGLLCHFARHVIQALRATRLSRGKVAGFGDEDAFKKVTQGVRKVIPKIENTFNAEEWSRKKSTNR